jgi:MYXO-CTERM domain-containing protein
MGARYPSAFRRTWSAELLFCVVLTLGSSLGAPAAYAEVTEPNGVQVPGVSSQPSETTLQSYFDSQQERINALSEASVEPGVFSPLCDFTATLVLSQSQAQAGLAWYNVPTSATEAPSKFIRILPNTTTTGQVIAASDIRSSADYAGGLIGFVLLKNLNSDPDSPVYYSEYRRNANCTGCSTPGYWKMMLAYRSSVHQSSYYIAFEDWEGANQSTWQGNDGDFNDKVFLITGVSCPGGGEPCNTGKLGLCSAGLTECAIMGAPVCKPQYVAQTEKCDNVDNDCDGSVDDGDLCEPGQLCVRGKCVGRCNTGEFNCPQPLVCGSDGYCIEELCKNVICAAGLACRGGKCVGVCEGITCPIGQVCQLDRCVDPCLGVQCDAGSFCSQGVCVGDCTCSGCPQGKSCARDGRCVVPGCDAVTCSAGQGCRAGKCVDACEGAVCPGAAVCANGTCGEPAVNAGGASSGGAASSSAGALVIANPEGGRTGLGGASAAHGGTTSAGGAATAGIVDREAGKPSGCSCRLPSAPTSHASGVVFSLGLLFAFGRRRRQPRLS